MDDTKTFKSQRTIRLAKETMEFLSRYKQHWDLFKEKCGDRWGDKISVLVKKSNTIEGIQVMNKVALIGR